jgi:hypothetical protein
MAQSPPIGQVLLLQPGARARDVVQVEAGRHLGAFAAVTDQAGVRLVAEGQPQGVDQDGLASPGLAGQGCHACPQFEFQLTDDGQILDEEMAQHWAYSKEGPAG